MDGTAIREALATTLRLTIQHAKRSALLAPIRTIQEVIGPCLTASVSALTRKHTFIHIRHTTTRRLDAHRVAAHIDFPRDVNGAELARCEFAPGVEDLTKLRQRRLLPNKMREASGNAIRHGNRDALPRLRKREGHLGLASVHEARLEIANGVVPDNHSDGPSSIVGECELVGALPANPDTPVGCLSVGALAGHANLGHVLAVGFGQPGDGSAAVEAGAAGERGPLDDSVSGVSRWVESVVEEERYSDGAAIAAPKSAAEVRKLEMEMDIVVVNASYEKSGERWTG